MSLLYRNQLALSALNTYKFINTIIFVLYHFQPQKKTGTLVPVFSHIDSILADTAIQLNLEARHPA